MDERAVLAALADRYDVGDDCAVLSYASDGDDGDPLLLTTDMLHDATDFPDGVDAETMGWRAAAASLSDVAAMGGEPLAVVLAAGTPDLADVEPVAAGAAAVCDAVGCRYAGGDVDRHGETTLASTALGRASADGAPVRRSGASPGDAVVVTGALGRTAVALRAFEGGDAERANELFRFAPRVAAGCALAPHASAMIDSSDGLAVSLHQIADASDVGFAVEEHRLPAVEGAEGRADLLFTGEDYELVATVPRDRLDAAREAVAAADAVDGDATAAADAADAVDGDATAADAALTVVGDCVPRDEGVALDGDPLPRRGYEH